jgi:hypothetical protein
VAAPFTPSRPDGRSDRRVVFDLVQDAAPDTTFTYEDLVAALSAGLDDEIPRQRVYRAVAQGNRTLLRERERYLQVVTDVGYKVLRADEHLPVALNKKNTAESYMRRGAELLDHVKLAELSPDLRKAVEGNRLMFAGILGAIKHSERRHEHAESLIAELKGRIDRLEGQQEP